MFLHPRYDTDMGKTKCAASLEDKAQLWVRRLVVSRRFLRPGEAACT